MQKHVNLVDLVKSFPTNIYLQNLASIQKRTSPVKFAHLAEESDNGSVPNLSTKVLAAAAAAGKADQQLRAFSVPYRPLCGGMDPHVRTIFRCRTTGSLSEHKGKL